MSHQSYFPRPWGKRLVIASVLLLAWPVANLILGRILPTNALSLWLLYVSWWLWIPGSCLFLIFAILLIAGRSELERRRRQQLGGGR